MTKQAFIEMIENMPDNAELVVSNYTIGFVVTDVEIEWRIKVGGVEVKKYKVQLIQTYVFEYEVEAENRALAEVKAKELYKDYKNSNDFFTPSDVSHVKDTFKIVPAVLVDIREALCKECAQKEGK